MGNNGWNQNTKEVEPHFVLKENGAKIAETIGETKGYHIFLKTEFILDLYTEHADYSGKKSTKTYDIGVAGFYRGVKLAVIACIVEVHGPKHEFLSLAEYNQARSYIRTVCVIF